MNRQVDKALPRSVDELTVYRTTFLFFQPHNLISKISKSTTAEEQKFLDRVSQEETITASLLPIKTVGVQVSVRRGMNRLYV